MDTEGLPARLEARLARGRAAAEARMLATAVIRRKTGATTIDDRGLKVPEWWSSEPVKCRIKGAAAGQSPSKTLDIGGAKVQVSLRELHLPYDTDVRDGDLVEVTGSDAAGVWQVIEGDGADQQTARRVPVFRTDRPKEWESAA